jgi:hypothetical protein
VLALKVPEAAPAATVMDAGTVRAALVLVRVTKDPPAGAAWFSVTVQVLDAFGPRLAGAQLSEVGVTGATRLIVALADTAFNLAVIVPLWLLLTAAVVALKIPELAPAATVIEAGTVRAALVLVRATKAPPARAAWLSVTVQVLEAFGPKLVGAQLSEVGVAGAIRLMVEFAETPFNTAVIVTV